MALTKETISTGTAAIQTYKNDSGVYLNAAPIQEIIVIVAANLVSGQEKIISLRDINTFLKPKSIWLANNSNPTEDAIILKIYESENNLLGEMHIAKKNMPFSFPLLVLGPQNTLGITPQFDAETIYIYCLEVALKRISVG